MVPAATSANPQAVDQGLRLLQTVIPLVIAGSALIRARPVGARVEGHLDAVLEVIADEFGSLHQVDYVTGCPVPRRLPPTGAASTSSGSSCGRPKRENASRDRNAITSLIFSSFTASTSRQIGR
jgi:hypothetical protein